MDPIQKSQRAILHLDIISWIHFKIVKEQYFTKPYSVKYNSKRQKDRPNTLPSPVPKYLCLSNYLDSCIEVLQFLSNYKQNTLQNIESSADLLKLRLTTGSVTCV